MIEGADGSAPATNLSATSPVPSGASSGSAPSEGCDRRSFLKTAGAAGALTAAPFFVPSRAFGANDRIVMGIIGPGGRGRNLMTEFQAQGVEFGAVCDCFAPNMEKGLEVAANGPSKTPGKGYSDYRKMLEERKDLDAILIASPEHLHAPHLIDTVQAGFDSYCEKPMSHSIEEGNRMVAAVRATDRIVQIGMQRRSSPIVRRGKEVVDSGVLGDVRFVRVKWNWDWARPLDNSPLPMELLDWDAFCGPAGRVPFEPMKFRSWRFFWAFSGGNITDQGTHLMDVVQWYMGKEFDPVTAEYAECFGDVYGFIGGETPDVFTAMYKYPEFLATWTLDYNCDYQDGWSIEFHGRKATMALDNRGFRVYETGWKASEDSDLVSGKPPILQEKGALGSVEHVRNFLDCMKTRKEPNAPVEIGHLAVSAPHLGNIAYHHKQRAYMDAKARETWLRTPVG